MLEFFEKGFLATVGVLSLTREKTQAMVDELVKRGDLKTDEGKKLVDKLVARGQEEQDNLRKMVRQEVNTALNDLNLITKDDVKALNEKLDALLAEKPKS